jgi:hypothetical protein
LRIRPSQLILAFFAPVLFVAFQNCSGGFVPSKEMGSLALPTAGAGAGAVIDSDPVLKSQALAIIGAKCASCHDTASMGGITRILDVNHLVASGLVKAGDPTQGRLVGSIEDATMPPSGAMVAANELTTIKNWISSMTVSGTVTPGPTPQPPIPPGMTVASDAALKTQSLGILQVNCAGCHQSDAEGGISKIMNVDKLVSSGLVVIGDPSKGRLMGSINEGSMPPAGSRLAVNATDRLTLQNWIRSMSLVALDPANPPNDGLPALAPTFASISANILVPKCTMCHGATRADSGLRYHTHAETLRTVTVGNGADSELYKECNSGGMPEAPFKRLSAAELAAIKTWIDNGAANN